MKNNERVQHKQEILTHVVLNTSSAGDLIHVKRMISFQILDNNHFEFQIFSSPRKSLRHWRGGREKYSLFNVSVTGIVTKVRSGDVQFCLSHTRRDAHKTDTYPKSRFSQRSFRRTASLTTYRSATELSVRPRVTFNQPQIAFGLSQLQRTQTQDRGNFTHT